MSAKDATVCAKDATMSAKDATMCAKVATMCAKVATMRAKDATTCAEARTRCANPPTRRTKGAPSRRLGGRKVRIFKSAACVRGGTRTYADLLSYPKICTRPGVRPYPLAPWLANNCDGQGRSP